MLQLDLEEYAEREGVDCREACSVAISAGHVLTLYRWIGPVVLGEFAQPGTQRQKTDPDVGAAEAILQGEEDVRLVRVELAE